MTSLNFTVDVVYESAMFTYMHIVAVLSMLVAGPTFYLLYFKTNRNSQRYKILLINLVMWTTLMDIHFGVLFIPLPLFPLAHYVKLAYRCTLVSDPFARYSITDNKFHAIMCFVVDGVCGGITICFIFRNQAVLPANSRMKISDKGFMFVCILVYAIMMGPAVLMASAYGDTLHGEQFLKEYHPAMMWITTKPNWVVYSTQSTTSTMTIVVFIYFCLLLSFGGIISGLIAHTFYILAAQSHHMSERTKKYQRSLIINLIMQFTLLGLILAVPLFVFCISVLTYVIPYEVNWAFFCCELLHSMVHSVTLILTTRSYKDTILHWMRIKKRNDVQFVTTASVSVMR